MKLLPHFLFLPFFALLAAPLAAAPISPQTHAIIMLLADAQGVPRSVANWLQVEESGDRNTGEWGRADARSGPDRFGSFSQGLYQISTRSQDWLVKMFYPHPAQYFDVWTRSITRSWPWAISRGCMSTRAHGSGR